jgi:acetyltransferase-like isoleucine patch superfamily enzyme
MTLKFTGIKPVSSHGSGEFERSDFAECGDGVVFEPGVLVFHPENISLGSNIYIGHQSIIKGYYKNRITIGDGTWIGQNCFFHGAGGLSIGKAVGIGPKVSVITSAHKDGDLELPVLHHEIEFKPVAICDGSDIGVGSVILPGVTIGEGAIVGAGSVVTRDVEPYSIVAGSPARLLRMRGK